MANNNKDDETDDIFGRGQRYEPDLYEAFIAPMVARSSAVNQPPPPSSYQLPSPDTIGGQFSDIDQTNYQEQQQQQATNYNRTSVDDVIMDWNQVSGLFDQMSPVRSPQPPTPTNVTTAITTNATATTTTRGGGGGDNILPTFEGFSDVSEVLGAYGFDQQRSTTTTVTPNQTTPHTTTNNNNEYNNSGEFRRREGKQPINYDDGGSSGGSGSGSGTGSGSGSAFGLGSGSGSGSALGSGSGSGFGLGSGAAASQHPQEAGGGGLGWGSSSSTTDFGGDTRLIDVWPPLPIPYNCSCCSVLREIIHTNGEQLTRLEIHGRLGILMHAILQVHDITFTTIPGVSITNTGYPNPKATTLICTQIKMFDFFRESMDGVRNFLTQYMNDRAAAGFYVLQQDPLSPFYDTMSVGLHANTNPLTHPQQHQHQPSPASAYNINRPPPRPTTNTITPVNHPPPPPPTTYIVHPVGRTRSQPRPRLNTPAAPRRRSNQLVIRNHPKNPPLRIREPPPPPIDRPLPIIPVKLTLSQKRKKVAKMTFYDFSPFFHLPLKQASFYIDLCDTTIKKKLRQFRVKPWPYRKVKSARRHITLIQDQIPGYQEYEDANEKVAQAKQRIGEYVRDLIQIYRNDDERRWKLYWENIQTNVAYEDEEREKQFEKEMEKEDDKDDEEEEDINPNIYDDEGGSDDDDHGFGFGGGFGGAPVPLLAN